MRSENWNDILMSAEAIDRSYQSGSEEYLDDSHMESWILNFLFCEFSQMPNIECGRLYQTAYERMHGWGWVSICVFIRGYLMIRFDPDIVKVKLNMV